MFVKFDDTLYMRQDQIIGLISYMGEYKVLFTNGQFKVVSKNIYDKLLKIYGECAVDLTKEDLNG